MLLEGGLCYVTSPAGAFEIKAGFQALLSLVARFQKITIDIVADEELFSLLNFSDRMKSKSF
jgi:hypothetical protein